MPCSGRLLCGAPALTLFDSLPNGLLEHFLTSYHLTCSDLIAVHKAVSPSHPHLAAAVESAARSILLSHPHGRLVASSPLPSETALSALRFIDLLDNPAPPHSHTTIWSCGRNDQGQGARPSPLDSNSLQPTTRVPSDSLDFVTPPATIISIAAGFAHSVCLSALGAPHFAGANSRGQLGLPHSHSRSAWTPVPDLEGLRIVQVACGHEHTVLLTSGGAVLVSGANHVGQLATGDVQDYFRFTEVVPSRAIMVAAGRAHTVVLFENGSVYAAGDNAAGQLAARRDTMSAHKLTPIGCFGRRVVRVACGTNTTMLLTSDNMVLVTGKRQAGLSVIGGLGLSRVTHLALADAFAIVRTDERDVAISRHRKRFLVTDELLQVAGSSVGAGVAHYAIVAEDGSALAAGSNAFGQVAAGEMGLTFAGSANARLVRSHQVALSPVCIPIGYRALQVAAGAFHTLYLLVKN